VPRISGALNVSVMRITRPIMVTTIGLAMKIPKRRGWIASSHANSIPAVTIGHFESPSKKLAPV
jgi:hypothetical protein